MSSTESVEASIQSSKAFLESLSMRSGDRILVAFSGGPDSTALLTFLLGECDDSPNRVAIGYYNHNLRGKEQSSLESDHVAAIAAGLGVQVHCGKADEGEIRRYANKGGISVEESARILRYRFLRDTADSGGYTYIATGHTLDDTTETLIQRFFQGSGVWGLCGIPRVAGDIIRPILNWSRAEVVAFNAQNGLEPFLDPSNSKTMFLRNAIRHSLIPSIRGIFPHFEKSLETLALKMSLARDFIDQAISSKIEWKKTDFSYTLPAVFFEGLHAVERIETVRRLLNRSHKNDSRTVRIPFQAFSTLIKLPGMHDNAVLFRGLGYRLQIHDGNVVFERDVVFDKGKGYFKVIKAYDTPGWSVSLETVRISVIETGDQIEATVPVDRVSFPLIVRSRREGDVIKVGGISKDLKKLYNDWNVAEQDRWKIPVCEDRSGIIAVIGKPFGYRCLSRFSNAAGGSRAFYLFERC